MTNYEKEKIKELRLRGLGYGKISEILKLSKSTISSYCKSLDSELSQCLFCNAKIKQTRGHRQKKYCSNKCRSDYWKLHKDDIKRTPSFEVQCATCHKTFLTYKSLHHKYCSWDCFCKMKTKRDTNG